MADPAMELPKAVLLSVSSPLPKPVGGRPDGKSEARGESTDKENGISSVPAAQAAPRTTTAHFQATPVTAAAITLNLTASRPVIEHGKLTPEVRGGRRGPGERERRSRRRRRRRCLTRRRRPRVPPPQELDAQVVAVIEEYKEKLETRTDHHMG